MDLVFTSSNQNKIKEISAILPNGITVIELTQVGIEKEIPEPGANIKENAFLKAQFVYDFLEKKQQIMAVFSDDSGLEVEALQNAPGVYSARYAGIPKNDAANNQKLLKEMALLTNRKARFVTVITLIINKEIHYFEGEIKGTIAYEPRGNNGFGYDPLFIPQGFRSTFSELSSEIKNSVSHRAIATQKLVAYLKTLEFLKNH